VIDTDLNHPYFVTAADEALAISCGHGGGNALHFYRREPPAVSMGYFRKANEDVNLEECEALGVMVVRRSSGGGSIYTDKNQLIFSLVSKTPLGTNVDETFSSVCGCLINALEDCGITATYKPPNDVLVNDKKISGSALSKKKNATIIHSTLILKLDLNRVQRVLPSAKPSYISSIENECGFVPKLGAIKAALKNAMSNMFGMEFQSTEFTKLEGELIGELVENKYGTHAWNFKR
jgi:lipoate-protein ligase A